VRRPAGGRWEPWLLTATAGAAVLAVLRPDLYADALRHVVEAAVGGHGH